MITGRQIKAARALAGWDAADLAKKAKLSRETVSNIENDLVQAREASLTTIINVFNDYGVEFTSDEGVKKRTDSIVKLEGTNDLKLFMDQVYEAAQQHYSVDGTKPICICNLDNTLFRKYLGDYLTIHAERLKQIPGLKIRSLAATADSQPNRGADYLAYKYLKEFKATVTPFYVFADKFSIIDFNVENPPRILMIRSPMLASSYRDQFDILWKNASDTP